MDINFLSEQDAVDRIVHTLKITDPGKAPFVLVLGSGFSHGLVPMVKEIIEESLPLWMHHLETKDEFEELKKRSVIEKAEIAKKFWKQMVDINSHHKMMFSIDPNKGMPDNYSAAYMAAFDPDYNGALGTPASARQFQRALMCLDKPRLNAAHFLLASILGVQKTRGSKLFKTDSAFSRIILTTNFDPFLQTALQLVNQLYFMSDTMELGVNVDLLDDYADAIHLVYVHGSVHRFLQAASEDLIQDIKRKNADKLAELFKRRGVIVIGYSGWDDVIVEALEKCSSFDHLLYWCGLESDPLTKGAFSPRVHEILQKSTAFYVQIKSAGTFMANLCGKLVNGRLPNLLANPIGHVKEILENVDFKEFEKTEISNEKEAKISDKGSVENVIAEAKASAIKCLEEIEPVFQTKRKALKLLYNARLAGNNNNFEEALRLYEEALGSLSLSTNDKAELLFNKGVAQYFKGDSDNAIKDWTNLIELPEAPVELVAQALLNRGFAWGKLGETDKAIADFTKVIELHEAPVEQVANALLNRGFAWGKLGETDKAIADYTRLIELTEAPVELVAIASANRGWCQYEQNNFKEFLVDTKAALNKNHSLDYASFNLGLALLACKRDNDALIAYQQACEKFPQSIEKLGLEDLIEAQKTWLSQERAEPVIQLLKSFNKEPAQEVQG